MLGLKTLYVRSGDLCNKLFASILNDEEHKLRYLLPPKVTYKYNFIRNNKLFISQNTVPIDLEIHL
jgi:hypothetical protein